MEAQSGLKRRANYRIYSASRCGSWNRTEGIRGPFPVVVPLHVSVEEGGIAAAIVVFLRPVIEVAALLIRTQVGLAETRFLASLADQQGARRLPDDRALQTVGGDDQAVHV